MVYEISFHLLCGIKHHGLFIPDVFRMGRLVICISDWNNHRKMA